MTEAPTTQERLSNAANSSNLAVRIETRGDADYLIASGMQSAKLGRLVYQLLAEWDGREKPRPLTEAQIMRVAEQMPRKSRGRLDIVGARIAEMQWRDMQRLEILTKLPAFRKLVDRHAGFLPWVLEQGMPDAERKLADVLLWWCDRKCPCCGGIKLGEMAICETCKGFGTREVPHDIDGLRISEHIATHVESARTGVIGRLKQMKELKEYASGRD